MSFFPYRSHIGEKNVQDFQFSFPIGRFFPYRVFKSLQGNTNFSNISRRALQSRVRVLLGITIRHKKLRNLQEIKTSLQGLLISYRKLFQTLEDICIFPKRMDQNFFPLHFFLFLIYFLNIIIIFDKRHLFVSDSVPIRSLVLIVFMKKNKN